ncbi:hypothetical protein SDC9_114314 [bioreactor metagenome]|uniref:Uncharacterized protein n=1 Tax=bioreactor metagenome TaxID=1076179 RepID=A0A645BQD1_9ZZZZ
MEAEAAEISDAAGFSALVFGSGRVSAVLKNIKMESFCDIHDRIHVAHLSAVVNDKDCFCSGGYLLFYFNGINIKSHRINIGKYGGCAFFDYCKTGCDKGVRSDDDFISGNKTHCLCGNMHSGRAVGSGKSILCAGHIGKILLEFGNLRTHCKGILVHSLQNGLLFFFIVYASEEGIRNFQYYAVVNAVA